MPRMLIAAALALLAAPASAAAAACVPPPSEPGLVVAACPAEADLTGPAATGPAAVYRDTDPARLRDVRVTGRGSAVSVYVARLDRDGILMEATLGPAELPAGVPLTVSVRYEGAVLEFDGGEDAAVARSQVRRVLAPSRAAVSAGAAGVASAACIGFRRQVVPFLVASDVESILRQLRGIRRAREILARRLLAARESRRDARLLNPVASSLRGGNRHLLAAERRLRRTRDVRSVEREMTAYERRLPRERRLRRRLGLSECSG